MSYCNHLKKAFTLFLMLALIVGCKQEPHSDTPGAKPSKHTFRPKDRELEIQVNGYGHSLTADITGADSNCIYFANHGRFKDSLEMSSTRLTRMAPKFSAARNNRLILSNKSIPSTARDTDSKVYEYPRQFFPLVVNASYLTCNDLNIVSDTAIECNFQNVTARRVDIAALDDDHDKLYPVSYNMNGADSLKTIDTIALGSGDIQGAVGEVNTLILENSQITKPIYIYIGNTSHNIIFDSVVWPNEAGNATFIFDPVFDGHAVRSVPVIKIKSTDAGKFNLDYTKFKFEYFPVNSYDDKNAWRSDVESSYQGLIRSQVRLNNISGIEKASIELGQFQDRELFYGTRLEFLSEIKIWIKVWWNNYGFDKSNVLVSSTELFLIFFALNLFVFRRLLDAYDIMDLKRDRSNSIDLKMPGKRALYRVWLCLLYTGIIFYGLKFEIARVKPGRVGLLILLISEYVMGLISLAFIANLIITK